LSLEAVQTAIGQVSLTLIVIAVVVALLEGLLYLFLVKLLKTRHAVPLMLVAPAVLGLAILIGYPNNPTGAVMSRERLMDVARIAEKNPTRSTPCAMMPPKRGVA